jgi:hypothetical protein
LSRDQLQLESKYQRLSIRLRQPLELLVGQLVGELLVMVRQQLWVPRMVLAMPQRLLRLGLPILQLAQGLRHQ